MMQRAANNLLSGTLTNYALLFVTIGLGVFLMPFTMNHLGKAEYGLWMLSASLTAYLQLLDLGYGSGVVRQITQADARGDEDAINVILSTFAVVYSVIGLLALGGVAVLALLVVPRFPNLSAEEVATARLVLAILGTRMAIAFPMGIFGAITTARQRFALNGRIAVALTLLQGLATYLVLRAGYGLIPLVAATASIGVAGYLAYAAAAWATFPGLRLSLRRFSPGQVREVTSFSMYLFLISIAIHVGSTVDNLVIGAYLGTSAVAVYAVAVRLADYQRQFCGQFSGFLFPLVVRFDATKDLGAMRATLVDGTRIALGLVACFTIGLLAFGADLIRIWMGPEFVDAAAPLYILAVAGAVMVAQGPAGTILLSIGRHAWVAGLSLLEILLHVIVSVALVSRFDLAGVAIGTMLPYVLLNIGLLVPAACRAVGISLRAFAAAVLLPAMVGTLPALAAVVFVHGSIGTSSAARLLLGSAIVGLVYVAAFLAVGLRAVDRDRYLAVLRRATPALDRSTVAAS